MKTISHWAQTHVQGGTMCWEAGLTAEAGPHEQATACKCLLCCSPSACATLGCTGPGCAFGESSVWLGRQSMAPSCCLTWGQSFSLHHQPSTEESWLPQETFLRELFQVSLRAQQTWQERVREKQSQEQMPLVVTWEPVQPSPKPRDDCAGFLACLIK